jgi:hypothetical protein
MGTGDGGCINGFRGLEPLGFERARPPMFPGANEIALVDEVTD